MMRLSEAAHGDAQVVCSGWRHKWWPLEFHCVSFVYSECTQGSTLEAIAASTKPGNGAMAKALETITGWSSKMLVSWNNSDSRIQYCVVLNMLSMLSPITLSSVMLVGDG